MTHRYYDAGKGRFINRDPIGVAGGINLYGFVGNNPVTGADPSGHGPEAATAVLAFGGRLVIGEQVGLGGPRDPAADAANAGTAVVVAIIAGIAYVAIHDHAAEPAADEVPAASTPEASAGKAESGGERPANLSRPGSGRRGAFREAKRRNGIPVHEHPTKVKPNKDKRGKTQPGRIYEFGPHGEIEIREDSGGHSYPDDPTQNRGPHFNDPTKRHFDY